MNKLLVSVTAIVPAAGVGQRMKAHCPKQYLAIANKTILEHTVEKLLASHYVQHVIIAISDNDGYFADTSLNDCSNITVVTGGKERVDSVYAALQHCDSKQWVLVHDAARPCVKISEINELVETCINNNMGGLLASKVKDTMKRSNFNYQVQETVSRENLWHALTPQMFKASELKCAIEYGIEHAITITDESSAIEAYGLPSQLVEASSENIKITQPEDLALAEFILTKQQEAL